MTDIKTPAERSKNMAAIRSANTKPEQYICRELFSLGYRYRKNAKNIYGTPDLFLRKYNTAIFVHGCYWHRHSGCKYAYMPKSNADFWQKKFLKNVQRDVVVKQSLQQQGVKCLIVWECTVKKMIRDPVINANMMDRIVDFLNSEELYREL